MNIQKSTLPLDGSIMVNGYKVWWRRQESFETVTANFHLIAQIYAERNEESAIFVFFVDILEKTRFSISKSELEDLALEKVTEYAVSEKIFDGDIFTFNFFNSSFMEVQNPEWWEGKYSKALVNGLRVEAQQTTSSTSKNKSWRVTLYFKSKDGNLWLPTSFGQNHNIVEYFVWINSKELDSFDLSNTKKDAEVLAVQFAIERYEQTKDTNGDRSITRITERNSARFSGKWFIDSLLPEEFE